MFDKKDYMEKIKLIKDYAAHVNKQIPVLPKGTDLITDLDNHHFNEERPVYSSILGKYIDPKTDQVIEEEV